MKQSEVSKFLHEEVVGQLRNGLFFEAKVKERDGKPAVVELHENGNETIDPSEIRWLTATQRYC